MTTSGQRWTNQPCTRSFPARRAWHCRFPRPAGSSARLPFHPGCTRLRRECGAGQAGNDCATQRRGRRASKNDQGPGVGRASQGYRPRRLCPVPIDGDQRSWRPGCKWRNPLGDEKHRRFCTQSDSHGIAAPECSPVERKAAMSDRGSQRTWKRENPASAPSAYAGWLSPS